MPTMPTIAELLRALPEEVDDPISDDAADADRLRLCEEYSDWCWRSRYCGGEFDFGDEADFRRGVDLFAQLVARRYSRGRSFTPVVTRQVFGWRSIF